jgi:DNA-binding MarR family transcriptional regulator
MRTGSIAHLLHRAGQHAEGVFARELPALTPRQFAILVCLNGHSVLSQSDMVARTGIDRSTVADLVRRVAKKGLLRRRRNREDARAYDVELTNAGRATLRSIEPKARRVEATILSALSQNERKAFLEALAVIVDRTVESRDDR